MLGCTNYKKDGTGCSRTMTPKYFYTFMNIEGDEPAPPIEIPKGLDIKPKTNESVSGTIKKQESVDDKAPTVQPLDSKPIEYNGYDLNAVLQTILQALSDMSERKYYGATMLVDVLRGSKNKRIITDSLDRCKAYGKLSSISRDEVQYLIEWLIQNKYILQTKGSYPVLHPTYDGQHYGEVMTRQKLQALKRKMEFDLDS